MLGSKVMYLLLLLQTLVLNPGCASEWSLEIIKNAKSKTLLQKCRIRILRVGACHAYGRVDRWFPRAWNDSSANSRKGCHTPRGRIRHLEREEAPPALVYMSNRTQSFHLGETEIRRIVSLCWHLLASHFWCNSTGKVILSGPSLSICNLQVNSPQKHFTSQVVPVTQDKSTLLQPGKQRNANNSTVDVKENPFQAFDFLSFCELHLSGNLCRTSCKVFSSNIDERAFCQIFQRSERIN